MRGGGYPSPFPGYFSGIASTQRIHKVYLLNYEESGQLLDNNWITTSIATITGQHASGLPLPDRKKKTKRKKVSNLWHDTHRQQDH